MTTSLCSIMFIKIEGSAQLYSKLGDEAARQSINSFFEKVQNMITKATNAAFFNRAAIAIARAARAQVAEGGPALSGYQVQSQLSGILALKIYFHPGDGFQVDGAGLSHEQRILDSGLSQITHFSTNVEFDRIFELHQATQSNVVID